MTEYRIMYKNKRTGCLGTPYITHTDKEFLEKVIIELEKLDEDDPSGEFLYQYWVEPCEILTLHD